MSRAQEIAYLIIGLFIGVIFHEYMHARVADLLGDRTARRAGRLTLNPVPHIDPFGTVLVPLALLLLTRGNWLFGYAKPVPVNPLSLKKPKRDMLLVGLSGPMTNFTIAFSVALFGLIFRVAGVSYPEQPQLYFALFTIAEINVVLGFFNLIPVPPLDGSHVVEYFLSPRSQRMYESIAPYGFIIVLGFLMLAGEFFFGLMEPVFDVIRRIMTG